MFLNDFIAVSMMTMQVLGRKVTKLLLISSFHNYIDFNTFYLEKVCPYVVSIKKKIGNIKIKVTITEVKNHAKEPRQEGVKDRTCAHT